MTSTTLKRKPKAELKEWLAALDALFAQAKAWADDEGWATKEFEKSMSESVYGDYIAPQLLIHTREGRLMLDPVAGSSSEGLGVVDFCSWPGFDRVILTRRAEGWFFLPESRHGKRTAWNKRSFLRKARHLIELGR
jgi:hypothetical protein